MPAFALRAALGEMADEMLLASCRVQPAVLVHGEFDFLYGEIREALRRLLAEEL
jgi:NAD dependent epimerase/dehydratase family enzyme